MLVNCPIVNQRTEVGSDGRPPEDGNMDCVPASLASMARGLRPDLKLTGDGLHDAVYGQGYVGMMDPARFVGVLATDGLTLTPYQGTPTALVTRAVAELDASRPVLLSIPSDWNNEPPHSPYAHMVAACDVAHESGVVYLTAMNPWTATYQKQAFDWWVERLAHCSYHGMWVMEVGMPIPQGWKDDGTTLVAVNKVPVIRGFRDHILAAVTWNAALVPVAPEYGLGPGHVRQDFAMSLEWTPAANVVELEGHLSPAAPPLADPLAQEARDALARVKRVLGELP